MAKDYARFLKGDGAANDTTSVVYVTKYYQKAVNEKEYLTSQLLLQARQLWLNLNVAWEQMKVAEENLNLAEKTVYDQMSRFNAGLVPISDVLMNQTTLFEATENLIDKQIEYSKALTAYNGRKAQ